MKNFELSGEEQARFYKSFAEDALERIIGDRFTHPSPHHDRINLAHARMCAFYDAEGRMPNRNVVIEAMQSKGHPPEAILDVCTTIDVYANRAPVSDGKIALHLEKIGLPATRRMINHARSIAVAAMSKACLDAAQRFYDPFELPRSERMVFLDQASRSAIPVASVEKPKADYPAQITTISPSPQQPQPLDAPFRTVAELVIEAKLKEGLWNEKRANEVRASVNLFVEANGNLVFSSVSQQHLAAMANLMTALPKRYHHFMVAGQGGFPAALASVTPQARTQSRNVSLLRNGKSSLDSQPSPATSISHGLRP